MSVDKLNTLERGGSVPIPAPLTLPAAAYAAAATDVFRIFPYWFDTSQALVISAALSQHTAATSAYRAIVLVGPLSVSCVFRSKSYRNRLRCTGIRRSLDRERLAPGYGERSGISRSFRCASRAP